jgi:hypothetical protein
MIPPLLLTVHADALSSRPRGFGHGSVRFDVRAVEELCWLLSPDVLSGTINALHEVEDLQFVESPAEVSRSRWVRSPLGASCVEVGFVSSTLMVEAATPASMLRAILNT